MSRTLPKEVSEAILRYRGAKWIDRKQARLALESAILAAIDAAREGALREAEDVLQRYLSKQDHQNQTVYDATCVMIDSIRLLASRPEPAACIDCGVSIHDHQYEPGAPGEDGRVLCPESAASALRRIGGDLPSPEAQRDNLDRNLDALGAEPAPESGGKTCGVCGSVLCCDLPSLKMRCPKCEPTTESNRKPYPVTPTCGAIKSVPLICSLYAGHDGPHAACHVTPTIYWDPRPSPAAEPAEERVTAARVAFVRQYAEEPVCPVDDRPHLLGCIKCGRPSPPLRDDGGPGEPLRLRPIHGSPGAGRVRGRQQSQGPHGCTVRLRCAEAGRHHGERVMGYACAHGRYPGEECFNCGRTLTGEQEKRAAAERDLASLRAAVEALAGEMDGIADSFIVNVTGREAYRTFAARLRALLPGDDAKGAK